MTQPQRYWIAGAMRTLNVDSQYEIGLLFTTSDKAHRFSNGTEIPFMLDGDGLTRQVREWMSHGILNYTVDLPSPAERSMARLQCASLLPVLGVSDTP